MDNFPLAAAAHSAADLPPIPKWSLPPKPHIVERTPLFIGFTRNWRLLQQVVVSYITAGWPAEDIYVIENTGVLDSNKLGLLSLQNPFFLNHTRLELLGVNVLITPTLFTFAQLQNYYLWIATVEQYPYYFWSHMDVVVLPFEGKYKEEHPELDLSTTKHEYNDFRSLYDYCVEALREVLVAKDKDTGNPLRWAMRFFSYDRLALVNVESFKAIGGWDTQIPFYMTDCDMHARLDMEHYNIEEKPAGMIYDVGSSMEDLIVLYRKTSGPNGTVIPHPDFVDPHEQAKEISAINESESQMKAAGWVGDDLSPTVTPPEAPKSVNERSSPFENGISPRDDGRIDFSGRSTTAPPAQPPPATGWEDDTLDSELYAEIYRTMDRMQGSKNSGDERNHWQAQQTGGQGEPFYRDSAGFNEAIQITIEHGRRIYREKWGHRDCDIVAMGLKPMDAWRVEHDGDDW